MELPRLLINQFIVDCLVDNRSFIRHYWIL